MKIKQLLMGALLAGATLSVNAQLLLNEQFNYGTTADTLTNPTIGGSVWKRHSGSGGPLQYLNTSLSYTGYPGNGIGGSISMAHATGLSKEDANRALSTPVSSGSVYVSFLLNVSNSGGTTGDYSFHLNDSSGNGISTSFRAKMFFKDGGTPGTFKLGFAKGGAATVAAFSATDYNLSQTYMVVVKYVFNTGSAADDSVYATVFSSGVPVNEVDFTYAMACTDITQSDLAKIKSVCIRQGTVGTGAATIDGIRVATSWDDLITATPSPVAGLTFNTTTQTTSTLSWTKPGDYVDGNFTTLVFLKEGSAITQGTPNAAPGSYTAIADFSLSGTAYQNDAASKCVSSGDGLSVNVTGLNPNTTYYALVYVVKDVNAQYSDPATASATTLGTSVPPVSVQSLMFKSTTQTTTTLAWTKDASYVDDSITTLVFVKPASITIGTPTMDPAHYTANSDVSGNGTPYQNDAAAKCVYNGDGDSVNLIGLTAGTLYEALVFTVNIYDSAYSASKDTTVTTMPPPYLLYSIGQINTVNPTTGVPDSLNVRVRIRGVVYGFNQLTTSGVEFMLKDATGGTTIYSPVKNFGYTVSEGDSLEVTGQVNKYMGLHETDRIDTIIKLGTVAVTPPVLVTALNESTENNLVRLNGVSFLDAQSSSNWPSGNNVKAKTAAGDTITIRVYATSELAGKPLPTTPTFDVIGLGSQFTSTPANFNGYQIYPRSESDIIEIPVVPSDSLLAFDLLTPANNDTITITNSNLGDSVYITWSMCMNSNGVDMATYTLEIDTAGADFSNPLLAIPTDISNVLPLIKNDIYTVMQSQGLPSGQIFGGIWRVKAESNGLLRYSTSTYNLFLKNDFITGLSEQELANNIKLYPNPANDYTLLSGLSIMDEVMLMDITGKELYATKAIKSDVIIPTQNMPSGIYFIKVRSDNAIAVKKLLIH